MSDGLTAQRQIVIDCGIDCALAFVGDARNLPTWTHFFKKALAFEDGQVRFETPIGACVTRVQTRRGADWAVARILSRFGRRAESALMEFRGLSSGLTVTSFFISFPPELLESHRTTLLEQLERELAQLKSILERKAVAQ